MSELDDNNAPTGEDEIVNEIRADIRAFGEDLKSRHNDYAAQVQKVSDRLDRLEVKMNRPGGGGTGNDNEIEMKAFTTFLRQGREALDPIEVKSLRIADDTSGGYLAPPDFSREVDKNVVQFSPVREAARVGSTSSASVIIPRRTGAPTAVWVGEVETHSATQPTYGQVEIFIHEIACYIDVANRLLEDGAVDVAGEVAFDLAEEFGRIEGEAFIKGNGVKKPLGMLNDADVLYTASGQATTFDADALLDLMYALAPFYRQRGAWLLNGKTLAAIRKLKDGNGQYIWQPGLAAGQPETIFGRPAVEAVDMPDIGAGTFPVLFGDFESGFRIYDRIALALLRDPYSVATTGLTRFHARRRVGAHVVRSEAIRSLKVATS